MVWDGGAAGGRGLSCHTLRRVVPYPGGCVIPFILMRNVQQPAPGACKPPGNYYQAAEKYEMKNGDPTLFRDSFAVSCKGKQTADN